LSQLLPKSIESWLNSSATSTYSTAIINPRYPDKLFRVGRDVSGEQLSAEVKSIYAGLVVVESKCIHAVKALSKSSNSEQHRPSSQQWQTLIALHRTLLHEHHDFLLASQDLSARPALRRLATKYDMPARMWRHGIYWFLELLRELLPVSLEYFLSFIYTAYNHIAVLLETVPAFKDCWVECLGDLSRYQMSIGEQVRDREIWAGTSISWYTMAQDANPTVGRLCHHLVRIFGA
jgi:hypothetical protein